MPKKGARYFVDYLVRLISGTPRRATAASMLWGDGGGSRKRFTWGVWGARLPIKCLYLLLLFFMTRDTAKPEPRRAGAGGSFTFALIFYI